MYSLQWSFNVSVGFLCGTNRLYWMTQNALKLKKIKPILCKFYLQANLLLRNFRHCSDQVKCVLFQTYCTNLYCCQLWFNSTKSSLKKLSTSYNSVLRRFIGICKPYSANKMFVSRGIPTFAELLRTSIYRFAQRIEHSSNCIISATLLPLMYISSSIQKWWNCILYVK